MRDFETKPKEQTYFEHRREQLKAIKLERIEKIESRFYGYKLHLQVEEDFAWLILNLRRELRGNN